MEIWSQKGSKQFLEISVVCWKWKARYWNEGNLRSKEYNWRMREFLIDIEETVTNVVRLKWSVVYVEYRWYEFHAGKEEWRLIFFKVSVDSRLNNFSSEVALLLRYQFLLNDYYCREYVKEVNFFCTARLKQLCAFVTSFLHYRRIVFLRELFIDLSSIWNCSRNRFFCG